MNIFFIVLFIIVLFSNSLAVHRVKLYKRNSRNTIYKESSEISKSKYLYSSLENHALNLENYKDAEYYGVISLGIPHQNFEVVLATGFPYFWVPSKRCRWFIPSCWDHKIYDSSLSSTYKENGKFFSIDDRNGKLSGFISEDTLTISNLIITNQSFGEMTKQSGISTFFDKFDGILGLSFSFITSTGKPPLASIISSGVLEKNIFSVFLNKIKKKGTGGEIIFGGWDINKFNSNSIDYIPLVDNTAWVFDLDYIVTDDGEQLCYTCQAVADTGVALIIGHKDVVNEIHKKIGAKIHGTEATVDCSKIDKLPSITFRINKKSYKIEGRDYIIKEKFLFFFIMSGGHCWKSRLLIQTMDPWKYFSSKFLHYF